MELAANHGPEHVYHFALNTNCLYSTADYLHPWAINIFRYRAVPSPVVTLHHAQLAPIALPGAIFKVVVVLFIGLLNR